MLSFILEVRNNIDMQSDIDFTTGGLRFYDADPPKADNIPEFTSDLAINRCFDPVPSRYLPAYLACQWRSGSA
jgi:hypothetical protein